MFRSIRWGLLSGYAAILLAVLGTFSGVLYYKLHRSTYKVADAELMAHAQAIVATIEPEGGGYFDMELSSEYQKYFTRDDDHDGPYFVAWDDKGKVIFESRRDLGLQVPKPESGKRDVRQRRHRREAIVSERRDVDNERIIVLVGKSMKHERERLNEFLGALFGIAGGVLVLALAGGWFLAGRVLRPIARMSKTAGEISASNLHQRIDVAATENELGRLATTLNEAFDRLEKAFERQTHFTADASHELRTPLSILMTHCELALKKDRSAPEYREAIETCLRAAQRMKAVVEGLLTLARADAKEINLQKGKLDFRLVVEETASMLGPMAIEKKVALTVSAESVGVAGDRERLREVVSNLVTNAIRYNREGGKVDVTVQRDNGGAVLTVSDTGIGIPEKDQAHIFERFYRVDKARSRELGGSGLGLSITKWIVEAHGGTIVFTSREGEGTTFTVRLPRSDA